MGNHELYMRRRKPDSIEVQQMKAQAREGKSARLQEQERVQAEVERRKQAEQDRIEMQKKVEDLERSAEAARQALEDQTRMGKELDDKRRQAEEAQLRLQQEREETARQHERMMERVNYEQGERDKIVQEMDKARLFAEEKAQEAQTKDNEARQLEQELREATIRVLQAQQATNNNHYTNQSEEYRHPIDDEGSDEDENSTSRNGRGVELNTYENVSRHEENRTTATTKDQNIKRKLETLKDELGSVQNSHKVTDNDRLHEENVASGRDKYKTLKAIRQGNTKKRIDEFESM